jgi:hypothetical protein
MTAYVANHRKKARTFRKREEELRHAVRHGSSVDKLQRAVERLREAKFAMFKSRFSQHSVLPASQFLLEEVAERDPSVARWMSMSPEEIIAKYSQSTIEVEGF